MSSPWWVSWVFGLLENQVEPTVSRRPQSSWLNRVALTTLQDGEMSVASV